MASSQPTAVIVDRPPHTTTPDWVHLSDASIGARETYTLLKIFAEEFASLGRDEPVSAQSMLAEALGKSQSTVSGYVQELRVLGAIETQVHRGAGGGLIYRIRASAPEGYTGPTTLVEFLVRRRARLAAAANAEATNVADAGATNVAPANGTNVRAANGTNVAPRQTGSRSANVATTNGHNVGPTNGETLANANGATPTTNGAANHPFLPVIARLLDAAEELGMWIEDPSGHRKMTAKLLPMLEDGFPEPELHRLITTNLGGGDTKIAIAMTHLNDAARRGWHAPKASVPRQIADPCRKGEGHDRFPADDCRDCRLEAREDALYAAGKLYPRRRQVA